MHVKVSGLIVSEYLTSIHSYMKQTLLHKTQVCSAIKDDNSRASKTSGHTIDRVQCNREFYV